MAPFFVLDNFIRFLEIEKRYSDHTLVAYRKDLSQFIVFLTGQGLDNFNKVNHRIVRQWMVELINTNINNKSVNRKLSALRAFYKWFKKENEDCVNPMVRISGPKSNKRLPLFAKESQLKEDYLDQFQEDDLFNGVRDRLLIEVFYATGIRLSELIGLKESDVQDETIKVLGKRKKERIIPISPFLNLWIEKYRHLKKINHLDSDHFFVLNNGKKLYPKFVYRKINFYLGKATDLEKCSPHVLRHTFATHLLNNGAGLESLKDLLGHANLSATQVYTHNSFAKLTNIYSHAHPRGQKNN